MAVLRLCGPATRAILPFSDFPADLKNVIGGMYFYLNGGYQYNGSSITDVDEEEVKKVIEQVHKAGWLPTATFVAAFGHFCGSIVFSFRCIVDMRNPFHRKI